MGGYRAVPRDEWERDRGGKVRSGEVRSGGGGGGGSSHRDRDVRDRPRDYDRPASHRSRRDRSADGGEHRDHRDDVRRHRDDDRSRNRRHSPGGERSNKGGGGGGGGGGQKEKKSKKKKHGKQPPSPALRAASAAAEAAVERVISMAELDDMVLNRRAAPQSFFAYPTADELKTHAEETRPDAAAAAAQPQATATTTATATATATEEADTAAAAAEKPAAPAAEAPVAAAEEAAAAAAAAAAKEAKEAEKAVAEEEVVACQEGLSGLALTKPRLIKLTLDSSPADFDALTKGMYVYGGEPAAAAADSTDSSLPTVMVVEGVVSVAAIAEEYQIPGKGFVNKLVVASDACGRRRRVRLSDVPETKPFTQEHARRFIVAARRSGVHVPGVADVGAHRARIQAYLTERKRRKEEEKKLLEAKKRVSIVYQAPKLILSLDAPEFVLAFAGCIAAQRASELWRRATKAQLDEAKEASKAEAGEEYLALAERLSKVREAKAQRRADLGSLEDQVRRTHRRVLELGQLEAEEAARAEKACVEGQKTAAVYENRRKRKRDEMPAVRQQQDAELGSLRARDAALRAVRSEADERRDHAEQQVLNLQTLHTQAQTQQDELEDQMCCLHKRVAEQAELQARLMKRFATLSLDVDALECGLEDRTGPQLSSLAGL